MPNVVDTGEFHPAAAGNRRDGPVRLINVASLDEKKGHEFLLVALARARVRHPDIVLDIIGDGPLRRQLEARARELGLATAVRFHGARSKTEVAVAMREADVFVLPSVFENAPLVLIEAMASGLPSVATAVGGIEEMIDSRSGLLVPARDAGALADALLQVVERRGAFHKRELAGLARERWGHEAVGRLWSQTYSEVLERRARARA
jgi:colanic acid/amylovoran biosynthesis glycosyltransferase